jgi:hypothetical protein
LLRQPTVKNTLEVDHPEVSQAGNGRWDLPWQLSNHLDGILTLAVHFLHLYAYEKITGPSHIMLIVVAQCFSWAAALAGAHKHKHVICITKLMYYLYIYMRMYIYIDTRRFPRRGVAPNHPKLEHFSIETDGFGDHPL